MKLDELMTPMPFSAACRWVSGLVAATDNGGCGSCTGLGVRLRGGTL